MRSILKSRKGISPILATLLLIVIAVAAIVVTYAWIMTFLSAQTESGGTLLKVENVYWNVTGSTTTFWVKNIGTSSARIVSLYIGMESTNLLPTTVYTDIGTGTPLAVDETAIVVLDWPNNLGVSWTSAKWYHFKFATEAGAVFEFSSKTPS